MLEYTKDGEKYIVRISQNIVASGVNELKEELAKLLKEGADQLTIDLEGVELIDSMGLGVLIATHNSLRKKGTFLVVIHACDNIRKLFQDMRLDQHFEIAD